MFEGLSDQEFLDIHESVEEAMAYVALPVEFVWANPGTVSVDPLWGEASAGPTPYTTYATIRASIKQRPSKEYLTRMGLSENANLLLFIPRQHIIRWETDNGKAFAPSRDMKVRYLGDEYDIIQEPNTDPLPVGDGTTTDYIGMVVQGKLEQKG